MNSPTADQILVHIKTALHRAPLPNSDAGKRFARTMLANPELRSVEIEDFRAISLGIAPGTYQVWFITDDSPQSVFYDANLNLFGTCWGPDAKTGKYIDLGFRDENPFEMFLA